MKKRLKEKKIYFPIFSSDFEGHDIYTKSQEITPPPPLKGMKNKKIFFSGIKRLLFLSFCRKWAKYLRSGNKKDPTIKNKEEEHILYLELKNIILLSSSSFMEVIRILILKK